MPHLTRDPERYTARQLIEAGEHNHRYGEPAYHRNRIAERELRDYDDDGDPCDDAETLVRWAINYYRHHLTDYDKVLEQNANVCLYCEDYDEDEPLEWAADWMSESDDEEERASAEDIDAQIVWSRRWFEKHDCGMNARAPTELREELCAEIERMMEAEGLSESAL